MATKPGRSLPLPKRIRRDRSRLVLDLIEVRLCLEQIEVFESLRETESPGAEEVENVPEHESVAVDEVVALSVQGRRHVLAAEHRADHRVRVAAQREARRRVDGATHVQCDHLIRHRPVSAPVVKTRVHLAFKSTDFVFTN